MAATSRSYTPYPRPRVDSLIDTPTPLLRIQEPSPTPGSISRTPQPCTCTCTCAAHSLPDDVFASALLKFNNPLLTDSSAQTPAPKQKNSRQPTKATETETIKLIHGPLTREQNSRALVAGVIADMRTYGPAVGTNPDLDTPAREAELLKERGRWTLQLASQERVRAVDGLNVELGTSFSALEKT